MAPSVHNQVAAHHVPSHAVNAVMPRPDPQNPSSGHYRVTAYPASSPHARVRGMATGHLIRCSTRATGPAPAARRETGRYREAGATRYPAGQTMRRVLAASATRSTLDRYTTGRPLHPARVAARPLPVAAPLPAAATHHAPAGQHRTARVAGSGQARTRPGTALRRPVHPDRARYRAPPHPAAQRRLAARLALAATGARSSTPASGPPRPWPAR